MASAILPGMAGERWHHEQCLLGVVLCGGFGAGGRSCACGRLPPLILYTSRTCGHNRWPNGTHTANGMMGGIVGNRCNT